MSSEPKYTGMAKLFAIEEKQQREKAAKKVASENISSPENISPTEINAAPEILPAKPLKTSAAENSAAPAIFSRPEQHTYSE